MASQPGFAAICQQVLSSSAPGTCNSLDMVKITDAAPSMRIDQSNRLNQEISRKPNKLGSSLEIRALAWEVPKYCFR